MRKLFTAAFLFFLPVAPALAHGGLHDTPHAHEIPVAVERNHVNITEHGDVREIDSNGIPVHETGRFPNAHNPNAISAQNYVYTVPLHPTEADHITRLTNRMDFGVALNGVPFDPGTAEFYNNDPHSGWVLEAITGGRDLGLDNSNAHVQRNGAYHYHGIPWGMVPYFNHEAARKHGGLMLVGYAADGFPIYMPVDTGLGMKSSYRIKQGSRPSGPGGAYDGRYTEDWEYVAGLGDLDECNGIETEDGYAYMLTEQFPFIPRCFKGSPDPSFDKGPPARGGAGDRLHRGPDGRRPPPDMRPDMRPPPGPF